MANQPTSFRFPFNVEGLDPKVQSALRYVFSGTKDLNDAIVALVPKVTSNTASITTIRQTIAAAAAAPPPPSPVLNIGGVNLQPNLTPGAYTISQSDFGGLIFVNS